MTDNQHHRPIRSFVVRPGRMTAGQRRALEDNWPRWGIDRAAGLFDGPRVFGRQAPLVLEIGFGMGQSLVEMAVAAPDTNYLGIEVHRPGIGRLMYSLQEQGIDNVRVYRDDAVAVLGECIAESSLDGVQIFFPDPWHKKRHHKRRLIQATFVELLCSRLKPGGFLHLATDWENYAEQMLALLSAATGLENTAGEGKYSPRPQSRPLTKFEKRGQRLGHGVWDLLFRRRSEAL
jgi:tRNA (guanine-N7-)-methyltransferase